MDSTKLLVSPINKQINLELHAAHIYNSVYCYLQSDSIGFIGTAEFFKKSSDEENEHARKFMEYQNTRGGKVILVTDEKGNSKINSKKI